MLTAVHIGTNLIFLVSLLQFVNCQTYVGDLCTLTSTGQTGQCQLLATCEAAKKALKSQIYPQTCGFEGTQPVVCCAGGAPVTRPPSTATTTRRTTTGRATCTTRSITRATTRKPVNQENLRFGDKSRQSDVCRFGRNGSIGQCVDFERCPFAQKQVQQNEGPQICEFRDRKPIVCCPTSGEGESISTLPIGTKSKKKCEEYGNRTIAVLVVAGGTKAITEEFPHMAALGFGKENDIQWLCGGSLISEEFVLTAAHCLYSQEWGEVKYVRLGALYLRAPEIDIQDFQIASVHRNPEYIPPSQYNDIALVKVSRPVRFSRYVKPACLQTDPELSNESAPIATGWGKLQYIGGGTSDVLMKVTLSYFSNSYCRKLYSHNSERRLAKGIEDETQICAGGIGESKDTCQGDSGGPLQTRSPNYKRRFYIVGVTSFGKACGIANVPGIYTRVSNYIRWIEETIWPDL